MWFVIRSRVLGVEADGIKDHRALRPVTPMPASRENLRFLGTLLLKLRRRRKISFFSELCIDTPLTVLGTGERALNETDKNLCFHPSNYDFALMMIIAKAPVLH